MAYTLTTVYKDVHGSQRVFHGVVTADATSGSVAIPSIGVVGVVHLTPKSAATAGINAIANYAKSAIATNGSVQIVSAASGDDFYITVYGR